MTDFDKNDMAAALTIFLLTIAFDVRTASE
jgi:hypothetical protein